MILRFQLPHAALAVFYGVDRSTVTRAVHEIRPLLAARGFAVPGEAGVRLHTLADVFAYATAKGVELRLDGSEVRVRRPKAGRPGRRAFVSGKIRQNTKKATVITDGTRAAPCGRALIRPGRMHYRTGGEDRRYRGPLRAVPAGQRPELTPDTRGLAKRFPTQVQAPPKKPGKDASAEEITAWEAARKQQSSERICVEHANAEHKQGRMLQRYLGCREYYDQTRLAIAGLVSDRTAER